MYGESDVARLLLQRNADLSARDLDGWTPLHYAASYSRTAILEVLLEEGSELESQVELGMNVLELATARKCTPETLELIQDWKSRLSDALTKCAAKRA
mmetsp:Transcript_71129/g.167650  ORF Transcript_71129/g.167650 Transcript_71129/m.167650 type:complete len:98 (-) Transcript_71129:220-513(-)